MPTSITVDILDRIGPKLAPLLTERSKTLPDMRYCDLRISAGDFSSTIVGDSYLIRYGRLAAPLQPNGLRMNDNVLRVINNILGIGMERRGTVRWSSDQVTWVPQMVVSDSQLEERNQSKGGAYNG